jgi:hypothetical protein
MAPPPAYDVHARENTIISKPKKTEDRMNRNQAHFDWAFGLAWLVICTIDVAVGGKGIDEGKSKCKTTTTSWSI